MQNKIQLLLLLLARLIESHVGKRSEMLVIKIAALCGIGINLSAASTPITPITQHRSYRCLCFAIESNWVGWGIPDENVEWEAGT